MASKAPDRTLLEACRGTYRITEGFQEEQVRLGGTVTFGAAGKGGLYLFIQDGERRSRPASPPTNRVLCPCSLRPRGHRTPGVGGRHSRRWAGGSEV